MFIGRYCTKLNAKPYKTVPNLPLRRLSHLTTPPPSTFSPTFPRPLRPLRPLLRLPFAPARPYAILSFKLADIGEGISEVEVLSWEVKEGDKVNQFDRLCEVQSDKAAVGITSRYTGKIVKLHYKVGDIARVGSPLCDIETDEGPKSSPAPQQPEKVAPSAPTPSPRTESGQSETNAITTGKGSARVLATPAVRFLAKKNALNLDKVKGTGKDGRVTKGDVLGFINTKTTAPSAPTTPTATPAQPTTPQPVVPPSPVTPSVPVHSTDGITIKEVIHLRGYPRAMVQAMNQSLSIPHLGYCDEIHMDKMIQFRNSLKSTAEARGIKKLSYMPFIIKSVSLAMKKYPIINSRINPELTEISLLSSHNIGIAVATPFGLVVPNIKNVQDLSIFEIAEQLSQIIEKASNNKLSPSDLTGSTISISNIGAIGGTYASPVLVPPQVCIGALGKVQKLPRFGPHGEVIPVQIMNISWSADHRVVDGASIANFSNLFKHYIEEPMSMLLDTK